jgi:hypothetical protein
MSDETPGASEPFDVDAWLTDPLSARLINAFTVEFVIRYMRDAAQLFDNDYESAMIFLSVLETNGRQNIRTPWFREHYADVRKALPVELARPVSRQAIAQSLGLSRETVRRKIAAMIKRGLLSTDARGGVITTRGVIGNDAFVSAQKRVVGYVRQFRADLLRHAGAPSF